MQTTHIAILDTDNNQEYDLNLIEAWRDQSAIKVHIYSDFETQEVRGKRFFNPNSTLFGHIFAAFKSLKDAKANDVALLITHISTLNLKTLATLLIARGYGLHVAGVEHDIAPALHGKRAYLYRWVHQYLLNRIVINSRFAYTTLANQSNYAQKLHVIHHGGYQNCLIKTQPRQILRTKLKLDKDTPYLLFMVDSITQDHGLDLLIEALSQIQHNNAHLIIVGNIAQYALKNSYERLIKELQLTQRITRYNEVDTQTKTMLLLACDAIVFPFHQSYHHTYILEAMSHSISVIASDIGVHQELIKDRFNGLLFKQGSGTQLAQTLDYFLHHKYLSTDLPYEALKSIRHNYTWQESAKEYLKLIS
ncbi:MAG: glycosyltransferase family 4 protein [Campylobacterales bacterium]|nr:glycosyltransferase family 4 protein [Campylobacterales bacterium]